MLAVLQEATAKIDEYARGMISGSGSTLFEELGLYYIGPIDGHNLDLIIAMLQGAVLVITPGCVLCRHLSAVLIQTPRRVVHTFLQEVLCSVFTPVCAVQR